MNDRSDDPSHHELTLLPRSYILLHHEYGGKQYGDLVEVLEHVSGLDVAGSCLLVSPVESSDS